ncbi:hypothetical protein E3J48_04890 [Candidatus Aerophobetes bacterium]|uniref:PAC2 family protein n=1 Tax=Aerophobetes bacterium TaxID=2030807 RepID=A0A523W4W0_UNCAE|nr:MAG: hypothetical protein E3J48_04890 [Candidatus Aerophobetes bacterium]
MKISKGVEMGVRIFKKVKAENPDLIACWSGIGNIGLIAVDTLRSEIQAEEFGEIEPWDFFYPRKVRVEGGLLKDLEFSRSKFYFQRVGKKDLIIFVGEEQPAEKGDLYASGGKAYEMASLVLDIAEQFKCKRVYTSGAAVAPIHHTLRSKVWAAANKKNLIEEIKRYENTISMSEVEGTDDQSAITGLNGLLLGVAKKRGLEGICLMGEIPLYLQASPLLYPKASKSVLEVLTRILGIRLDLRTFDNYVAQSEATVEKFYEHLPSELRDQLEKFKNIRYVKPAPTIPTMTAEDKKKLMEDVDRFLQKKGR